MIGHSAAKILALILIIILSFTHGDATTATFNRELPKLLQGVGVPYGRFVVASSFALWSKDGFVVARGNPKYSVNNYPSIVAVPQKSSSRVVAFGHESFFTSFRVTQPLIPVDRLVCNSVQWVVAAKPLPTGSINTTTGGSGPVVTRAQIAVVTDSVQNGTLYRTALNNIAGVIARETNNNTVIAVRVIPLQSLVSLEVLADVDVLFLDAFTQFSDLHVKIALDFMKQPGHGLLVAGRILTSWYPDGATSNFMVDLRINRILWPLGLGYSTENVWELEDRPTSPPPAWRFFNTYYLTLRISDEQDGRRPLGDSSVHAFGNAGLKLLVAALAPRATNGSIVFQQFSNVWKTLESVRAKNFSGVGPGPGKTLDTRTAHPAVVIDAVLDAVAIRNADLSKLKVSPSAALYPGLPQPPNAQFETINVTIDGTFAGVQLSLEELQLLRTHGGSNASIVWRSTGLYAPPGVRIQVDVLTPGAVGRGLQIQIGSNPDDVLFFDNWSRVPCVRSLFNITASRLQVGSPLGGPLYVVVPEGSRLGDVKLTFASVLRAPLFKRSSTELATWSETIRNYPGPRAELEGNNTILMVSSKSIRNMNDPRPALTYWDGVVEALDWLTDLNRTRKERLTDDVYLGGEYGWSHPMYPIMLVDSLNELLTARPVWSTLTYLVAPNFLMEPVYQLTNAILDVFTCYVKERVEGIPIARQRRELTNASRSAARTAYLNQNGAWLTNWSGWVAVDTYLQLMEGFGWGVYKRTFAAYHTLRGDPAKYAIMTSYTNITQTWMIITSEASGRNLIPFYEAWKFPITNATRTTINGLRLPEWAENPMKAAA